MQHLEVSGAVRPLKWPLGVKWLTCFYQLTLFYSCISDVYISHFNVNEISYFKDIANFFIIKPTRCTVDSCLQTCMTYTTAECTMNKLLMMDRGTVRNT